MGRIRSRCCRSQEDNLQRRKFLCSSLDCLYETNASLRRTTLFEFDDQLDSMNLSFVRNLSSSSSGARSTNPSRMLIFVVFPLETSSLSPSNRQHRFTRFRYAEYTLSRLDRRWSISIPQWYASRRCRSSQPRTTHSNSLDQRSQHLEFRSQSQSAVFTLGRRSQSCKSAKSTIGDILERSEESSRFSIRKLSKFGSNDDWIKTQLASGDRKEDASSRSEATSVEILVEGCSRREDCRTQSRTCKILAQRI